MAVLIKNGKIQQIVVRGRTYQFWQDGPFAGPNFEVSYGGHQALASVRLRKGEYCADFWSVEMEYRIEETPNGLIVHVHMHNKGSQRIGFDRVSLILGLDTYMDHYPEWGTARCFRRCCGARKRISGDTSLRRTAVCSASPVRR